MPKATVRANARTLPEATKHAARVSSKRESRRTVKKWAELEFSAISAETLENIKPASNDEWIRISNIMLPSVRIAWLTLSKSKDELKEIMAKFGLEDDGHGVELIEWFAAAEVFFRQYLDTVTAAKVRCISAASALELEARQ
jgi:hypothetical protein